MERGISVQLNIVAAVPFPNGGVVEEIPVSFLGKRERIPSVYKEAVSVTLSTTDDGGSMTMRFQYVPSVSKVTCVLVESSDDVPCNMLNELYCSDVANNVLEDCCLESMIVLMPYHLKYHRRICDQYFFLKGKKSFQILKF